MSWQSYVDGQLLSTNMVKHAVICGHDGNIWAASPDFKVTLYPVGPGIDAGRPRSDPRNPISVSLFAAVVFDRLFRLPCVLFFAWHASNF
jgi:hypothetical protein